MRRILFVIMAALFAACGKTESDLIDPPQNNPEQQPTEQPEAVTVSFAMKGEYSIEERPLARAAGSETESRDLYGINIYYDKEQDGEINDPYGYGLFDNVDDMIVTLLTGYKYKFVCSLVKEGKDKITYNYAYGETSSGYMSTSNYKGYGFPFCLSDQRYRINTFDYNYNSSYYYSYYYSSCLISGMNKFWLGGSYHLTGLGQGYTHYNNQYYISLRDDSVLSAYPSTDRYYGETTDYTPTEGGVVSIDMKRCVFGVQFIVSGISDGSFSFDVKDADGWSLFSKESIKSDETFDEEIHTYKNIYACWQNATSTDDYAQDFTINMTWKRGNNVTQTLDPLKVTFKRNVMTTVRINLNGGDKENSFDLKLENSEMGSENKDFDVDAGDLTDTPVEPA